MADSGSKTTLPRDAPVPVVSWAAAHRASLTVVLVLMFQELLHDAVTGNEVREGPCKSAAFIARILRRAWHDPGHGRQDRK